MKIGLVSPYDWVVSGGVNIHCARLSSEFRKRGHQVRIIAPSSRRIEEEDVITIGKRDDYRSGRESAFPRSTSGPQCDRHFVWSVQADSREHRGGSYFVATECLSPCFSKDPVAVQIPIECRRYIDRRSQETHRTGLAIKIKFITFVFPGVFDDARNNNL